MEIEITIEEDGTASVHVASLLYDLWEDYNLYRDEAESIDSTREALRYKRLVRASVHALFAYFEGVLNIWVSKLEPSIDLERTTFRRKIEIVRKAARKSGDAPQLDVKRARAIRNALVHVKPTDSDIQTMKTLLDGQFFRDADHFVKWLRVVSTRIGLECHPDVPATLKQFSDTYG